MKKGLLVLAMLALAASAWAINPTVGGMVTVESKPEQGASFIPTDTLKYHSIHSDGRLYYINPPLLYAATRFTPPYTGTIDSVYAFAMVSRAMTTPVCTLFFYKDTTTTQRQPGGVLAGYTFSFTSGARAAYGLKLRITSNPFPIVSGSDFWAGTMGLVGSALTDTMWTCMDTTHSWKNNSTYREFVNDNRDSLAYWTLDSLAGIPYNWGLSLFANQGSGVELLTPGGPVSLPPRVWASPNPFQGTGEIAYDLPKAARVELAIHDVSGRLIRTLVTGDISQGRHVVRWDGKDALGHPAASGVYLVALRAGSLSATRSLVIVR